MATKGVFSSSCEKISFCSATMSSRVFAKDHSPNSSKFHGVSWFMPSRKLGARSELFRGCGIKRTSTHSPHALLLDLLAAPKIPESLKLHDPFTTKVSVGRHPGIRHRDMYYVLWLQITGSAKKSPSMSMVRHQSNC